MTSKGVWLIRHGHTKLNSDDASKDYIRGWQNIPLDAEGKRTAKELVAFVVKLNPTHIYSSDLDRAADIARETAAKCKCPLTVSKDFRPWGLGDFEGKAAKDVVPQLQDYIDHPTKPVKGGGESFGTFKDRVLGAMRRVMKEQQTHDDNVVVFTHFRDIKLIEAWLAKGGADDIDAKTFAANDLPTGALVLLTRSRGRWVAHRQTRPRVGVSKPQGKS